MSQLELYLAVAGAGLVALNIYLVTMLLRMQKRPTPAQSNSACANCGYDVRFAFGGNCPECGSPVDSKPWQPRLTHCSFCSRSSTEVGPMAEGPENVYICAPCVVLCHGEILKNRRSSSADGVPSTNAL